MTTINYSVYSIPIFFLMNFAPHVYSVFLFTDNAPARWNNANPKATSNLDSFRKRAPAATYSRWERARAAHSNGYENLPILIAAVVLGNMAKLDAGTMNWAFGAVLVFRAAYILAYINIESQQWSHSRSVIFNVASAVCLWIIFKAGNVLSKQ
ncbi:MAG: hypothetical protein Q9207_005503 [Kuettlingeria erythrocarpa]